MSKYNDRLDLSESELQIRLARINQWINDAEALESHSHDHETICEVRTELKRLYKCRREIEAIQQRLCWLDRIGSSAFLVFCLGSAVLLIVVFFSDKRLLTLNLAACGLLLVILGSFGLMAQIAMRDRVISGQIPWQFRLRSLLIAMTVAAVVLASVIFYIRR